MKYVWLLLFIICSCSETPLTETEIAHDEMAEIRSMFTSAIDDRQMDSASFLLMEYRDHIFNHDHTLTNKAKFYGHVGLYHAAMSQEDSSIYYLKKASEYIPDSLASGYDFGYKINSKSNLALSYMKTGADIAAIETLEEVINMTFKHNYPDDRTYAYSLLSEIYYAQRRYDRAIEIGEEGKSSKLKYWGDYPSNTARIDRMIGLATASNPKSTEEEKREMLGKLLLILDEEYLDSPMDDILAFDVINQYKDILLLSQRKSIIEDVYLNYKDLPYSLIKHFIVLGYASVLSETGDHDEALKIVQSVSEWNENATHVEINLALYQIYKNVKQYDKALAKYELYNSQINSLTQKLHTKKFLDVQGKYDVNRMTNHSKILQERNGFIFSLLVFSAILFALSFISLVAAFLLFHRLRKKHNQLEEIDKNKDELFLILAHDLKGPMSTFDRMSKRVSYLIEKQDFENLEKLSKYFENIGTSLKYSVSNLLDWSLSQRNKFQLEKEDFDARLYLSNVISELKYFSNERGVNVRVEPQDSKVIPVFMDLNSFTIAFRNIIHNAIKQAYTSTDVFVKIAKYENHVSIIVENTGSQIDNETLGKLRDLIKRDGQNFGSMKMRDSGIGLSTSIKLLKFNNCKISIKNLAQNIVQFKIEIPVIE